MASVNKVILVGNLGADPEVRYMPNGTAVCNLRIATTDSWKDKSSGERKEATEWHSVVLFDKLAEIAGEYLRKGRSVYIEGRLQTRKWQDKETGADRYSTEIRSDVMQMLGGREGGAAPAESGERGAAPPQRSAPAGDASADYAKGSMSSGSRPGPPQERAAESYDEMDDPPF